MRGTKTIWFGLIACVITSACSSEDESASEPCAQRSGTYRMTFVEQSGNCGTMPEQIVVATGQPETPQEVDPACTGTIGYSADNCVVTNDVTCPGATGYLVTQTGSFNWSQDGSSGSGTLQVRITRESDGILECSSVYAASYVRI